MSKKYAFPVNESAIHISEIAPDIGRSVVAELPTKRVNV
jgi:hypothetical protein